MFRKMGICYLAPLVKIVKACSVINDDDIMLESLWAFDQKK